MTEGDRRRDKDGPLGRTLVLAADFNPIYIVSAKDAIWDLLSGNAEMIEGSGRPCRSPSLEMEIPSVIRFIRYHHVPRKSRSIPLTTRSVLARDGYECAYQRPEVCTGRATTVDHVFPRSKGGTNDWLNVVAACKRCNGLKGRKTLDELGWEILIKPYKPEGPHARLLLRASNPSWAKYFRKGR